MRVKKRNSHKVTAKRSIVQINKKWPKFSTVHCSTPVTPVNQQIDTKVLLEDLEALGQRVIHLESKLSNVAYQFDSQNRVNNCALQDFEKLKDSFESLSCEFQEFQKNNEAIEEEHEDESENEEEVMNCVEEIKWLKEHMLEFSESLRIQSECLKNLKCIEMPKIKEALEEKLESFEKSLEALSTQKEACSGNDLHGIKMEFECLKGQISCIACQLQDFEKQFIENQEMTCDELCSLRTEIMEKINRTFASNSVRASHTSSLMNTQNFQKPSCEVSRSPSVMRTNCDEDVDQCNECAIKLSETQTSIDQSVSISITQKLCHVQKQVSSQSVCMQQLVRDVANKVGRHEFECYCRKIGDTIDTLIQLRKDLKVARSNAAGTCSPMACMSCQTSANMKITTSSVPKLPPLKYGHENILAKSQHELSGGCADPQRSNSNWSCYSFRPDGRKAGGSHTKVNRTMQVKGMRYRRLKTPSCASTSLHSSLHCCKNEFQRNSSIF